MGFTAPATDDGGFSGFVVLVEVFVLESCCTSSVLEVDRVSEVLFCCSLAGLVTDSLT